MSQENVEIFLESLRCSDANDVEGFAALLHPEIESTSVEGWPEPGPFVGRDAVIAQFKRNLADWDKHRFTDIGVVADEGDWLVAEFRWRVRGAGSGIDTHFDVAAAVRLKDVRIIEWHYRWSREQALEAAGLSE
jgi:ketosteroid isomerase-like protein